MRRYNSRTVRLTKTEQRIKDLFDELLDEGHGIEVAARGALSTHLDHDPAFVVWLSDGTLSADDLEKAGRGHWRLRPTDSWPPAPRIEVNVEPTGSVDFLTKFGRWMG